MRYQITSWHGKGQSVFYVVDTDKPRNQLPAVVASYMTHTAAKDAAASLNRQDAELAY